MDYQIDTRNHRTQEVRVGEGGREVVVFRKVNFFIHNLKGAVGGLEYRMKLAAPWNGFRYQLLMGDRAIATARRRVTMHAFDANRPLYRHHRAAFDLDVSGRAMTLTTDDRHGHTFRLEEGGRECGRLTMRGFDAPGGSDWQADLSAPLGWSVPLAAFVAWLAREGRSRMSR